MAKTLSVKNPWASLIVLGIKNVENRSRPTKYRGRILIHASMNPAPSYAFTETQIRALETLSPELKNKSFVGGFENSAIIGEVTVVDCVEDFKSIWSEPGEFHWILKNPVLYKEPIKGVKGKLSIWEFDTAEHGLAL